MRAAYNAMISMSDKDRQILRDLAKQVAEVAADPIQQTKLVEWRRHNSLTPGKPMVLVYLEDVWEEFLPQSALQCEEPCCRHVEWNLRARLYRARHLRDDWPHMGDYQVGLQIDDPGCGLSWNYGCVQVDGKRTAAGFETAIADDAVPEEVVHNRTITIDQDASEKRLAEMQDLFGDILEVTLTGRRGMAVAMMDTFIQWRGIEEALCDMVDRPAWLHRFLELMTESEIDAARQIEALGALDLNNGADNVGSGGMGATDELPAEGFDGEHVRLRDLWGFATTQIFSEVSPAMHDEFAIQYEGRFLDLFGLNCYGCCEPLDKKVDLIRKLPRVRRVSMSPFVDRAVGAEAIGGDFIYSAKPNPSYLAADVWDINVARDEIITILDAAKRNGCTVEFVLNSTLTSKNEPHRYEEWADMVQDISRRYV